MATTQKGIYYPDNYDEVADIPADMKKMAESLENADFLQTLYRFKGTVDTVADLNLKTNVNLGDTYKCLEDDNNYTWNGTGWINIGQNVDLDEVLNEIDKVKKDNLTHKYHIDVTEIINSDTNITLPCYYKVGADCLDIYMCGHLLEKTTTSKEGNYKEIRRSWKYI